MRGPPPVRVVCRAGRGWRLFESATLAVGLASAAVWMLWWTGRSGIAGMAVGALAAVVAGSWAWRRPAVCRSATLAWTGTEWELDGRRVPPPVPRVLLGEWMLLVVRGPGVATRWLVADGATLEPEARRLRTALHARAPAPASVPDRARAHG